METDLAAANAKLAVLSSSEVDTDGMSSYYRKEMKKATGTTIKLTTTFSSAWNKAYREETNTNNRLCHANATNLIFS